MKKINWLDHIANLLVVILGITIAFYLEGYKEEANNRQQEKKYLQSLIEDLETDIEALDTLDYVNKRIANALIKLSNATSGAPYPKDSLVGFMFGIQYNPPFSAQRTAYESMKSSGKLDLISDFELRNEVVELYEQYYWGTSEFDVSLLNHINDFVKPYFMENIVFTDRSSLDETFLSSSEFRNIIYSYRYLFLAKVEFYSRVHAEVESTLDQLQSYEEKL